MRHQLLVVVFLLLVGLSLTGCVTKNPAMDPAMDPGGNYTSIAYSEFHPHLETLQARYDLTHTLKTKEMRVSIQEANRDPDELRELLWYKKAEDGSNLLHIQALGAFNDPRATAIANRDEFLLIFLDEHEGYLGKLSDGVLHSIFGIDLRVSDVLSALFANPFLDGRTENLKIDGSGNKFIVRRPGVEVRHTEVITLLIHGNEPQITEWRIINDKGKVQQRVFFANYRKVDGIGILRPHKVVIERPLDQTKVVVNIGKVELNVEISDSKFDIDPFLDSGIDILPFSDLTKSDGT